jgi:hypothetical protein
VRVGSGRLYFDPEGTVSILKGARDWGRIVADRVVQEGRMPWAGAG